MPTEADPTKITQKRVISNNDPTVAAGNTGQQEEFTGERVELPSRGLLYPKTSPASQGWVMVRPMTTKEEEILVTERFHKQGVLIDMLLSRCIVTKGINTLDLLSGDRLHLLFYLRAISYGPEYSFRTRLRDGNEHEVKTDVSKLKIKTLPDGFVEPWTFQYDGVTYELRLSRGKDEQEAAQTRMRNKKRDPNGSDSTPTDTLIRSIVSINGDTDRDAIAKHVTRMIAKTAHAVRAEINRIAPGPNVQVEVTNAEGELEEVAVQVTETFFRP